MIHSSDYGYGRICFSGLFGLYLLCYSIRSAWGCQRRYGSVEPDYVALVMRNRKPGPKSQHDYAGFTLATQGSTGFERIRGTNAHDNSNTTIPWLQESDSMQTTTLQQGVYIYMYWGYVGIMKRIWKLLYYILWLYRDNEKQYGNYHSTYWGYIGGM